MKDRLNKLLNDVYEHLFHGKLSPLDWSLNDVAEVIEYVKKKDINMYDVMPYELFKTIEEMQQLLRMKKESIGSWFDEELMKKRDGMTAWTRVKKHDKMVTFDEWKSQTNPKHKRLQCEIDGLNIVIREWVEDG